MNIKFYIHHYYSISLFYKLFHKTTNRDYQLNNNVGSIFCNYGENNLELIFDPLINDNTDGHHILDFLTCLEQINVDDKLKDIDCINRKEGDTSHRGKWGAEFGINDIPIMKWIAETLEKKSNWFIFLLRTEKSLIKYDGINYPNVMDLEVQIDRLKNHFIINDNVIFSDLIKDKYPNHFFCLTNTIHQWNELLSIRWYYEFKNIFEKLNQPYDLCFSMRYHKRNRTNIINGLAKLNDDRIYLSRVDNCKNKEFNIYSKKLDDNINYNINSGDDFDDITWIENIEHYLDYLMRILPMAKMHILSETWDWKEGDFTSNYLSEKTYGFLLAKIPFISTHPYPLEILQHILEIEPHPFYKDIKEINGNPEKFVEFVKKFMKNFEINKNLCILWVEKCHKLLMEKINTENTFLKKLVNNEFKLNLNTLESKNKKLL
jgi:hypothetical protein